MEITYEKIKSLIILEEPQPDGMMIKLKFKAENQETPIESVAVVTPDQNEIMKNAMKQAGKSAAISTGVNMAGNALGNAIGGVGGNAARSAGQMAGSAAASASMDPSKMMKTDMTDAKKQAAIVQAFSHLQTYYKWEGDKWHFVPPKAE
ncbi:MAG: hypothetical protein WDZ35_12290 [Crocinitomicaceae bacterium]